MFAWNIFVQNECSTCIDFYEDLHSGESLKHHTLPVSMKRLSDKTIIKSDKSMNLKKKNRKQERWQKINDLQAMVYYKNIVLYYNSLRHLRKCLLFFRLEAGGFYPLLTIFFNPWLLLLPGRHL